MIGNVQIPYLHGLECVLAGVESLLAVRDTVSARCFLGGLLPLLLCQCMRGVLYVFTE